MKKWHIFVFALLLLQIEASAFIGVLQVRTANAQLPYPQAAIYFGNGDPNEQFGVMGTGMINNVNLNNWYSDYIWTNVEVVYDNSNFFEVGLWRHLQFPFGYSQEYYYTIFDQGVPTYNNGWGSPGTSYRTYDIHQVSSYTWNCYVEFTLVKQYTFHLMNLAWRTSSELESQSTRVPDTIGKEVSHWQLLKYVTRGGQWQYWTSSLLQDPIPGYPFDNVHGTKVYDREYLTKVTS
jgi:hypothetical protein